MLFLNNTQRGLLIVPSTDGTSRFVRGNGRRFAVSKSRRLWHERPERRNSPMLPPQGGNRRLLDLPVDAEPIIGQDLVMWLQISKILVTKIFFLVCLSKI
uniref:(northern house mosquito) hypothetical protein n=1 Tax=Culex pipiens TaxID=7175 RepID=A0A8D8IPL7_CULPI